MYNKCFLFQCLNTRSTETNTSQIEDTPVTEEEVKFAKPYVVFLILTSTLTK